MRTRYIAAGFATLLAVAPGAAFAFDCANGAVTIGIARAKTGGFAFFDDAGRKGMTIAADHINAGGGIDGCQIKLIEGDTQSNPGLSGQVADELIASGAQIIMAPADFDIGIGASLSAQKAGLFAFSPEASSDAWTKAVGPNFITGGTTISDIAKGTAAFANAQGWKGAYIVTNPAFNYFSEQEPIFAAAFAGEVIGRDDAADDAADYSPIITKIRNAGDAVDVIFLNDYFPHVGTFIKQLRSAGLKTAVVGSGSYSSAAFPEVVGVEGVQDVYYVSTAYYEGDDVDPGIAAFLAAYKEKFGGAPDNANSLLSYYSGLILAEALKKAGSTNADAISAAIAEQKDLVLPGVTIYEWTNRYPRTSQTVIGFTAEGKFRAVETIDARNVE